MPTTTTKEEKASPLPLWVRGHETGGRIPGFRYPNLHGTLADMTQINGCRLADN